VIEVLDDGSVFLVWFTYPPGPGGGAQQDWIAGLGYIENDHIVVERLETLHGAAFGPGFDPDGVVREAWGRLEMVFSDCSRGRVNYEGPDTYGEGSLDIVRLSGIDGLACREPGAAPERASEPQEDSSLAGRAVSGSFFQPERDGEGWLLENLGDGRALAYWFTFTPDGEAAWLIGTGVIGETVVQFDEMLLFSGTQFGAGFDPRDVVISSWGSLNLSFEDCDRATVSYESTWGSGEIPVIRLTAIAGAPC
jgi:hypothetical protein